MRFNESEYCIEASAREICRNILKTMYKVGLYTLGCKVSLYETEAISESFASAGFQICGFDDVCDIKTPLIRLILSLRAFAQSALKGNCSLISFGIGSLR